MLTIWILKESFFETVQSQSIIETMYMHAQMDFIQYAVTPVKRPVINAGIVH